MGALLLALETHKDTATLTVWLAVFAAAVRIAIVMLNKYSGFYKAVAYALFLCAVISVTRPVFMAESWSTNMQQAFS